MEVFKKAAGIEKDNQQGDDSDNRRSGAKPVAGQLPEEEGCNGEVAKIAKLVRKPAALFRIEHCWRAWVNGTGIVTDGLVVSRAGIYPAEPGARRRRRHRDQDFVSQLPRHRHHHVPAERRQAGWPGTSRPALRASTTGAMTPSRWTRSSAWFTRSDHSFVAQPILGGNILYPFLIYDIGTAVPNPAKRKHPGPSLPHADAPHAFGRR